jgi:hypothetical protein
MKNIAFALGLGVFAIGCGSTPGSQVVSGRVEQSTFSSTVDRITVTGAGKVVAETQVQADGSFTITIPPGSGYHLNFSASSARTGLINPRKDGTLGATFAVRGNGAAFDLGTVRYIGDATTHVYTQAPAPGATGDGECENGIDPTTNAVCVDDAADGESCNADDGETNDDGTADGETADDGAPDGETADDGAGGANDEEANDDNGDGVPDQAAVADRNLPPTMGCGDQGGDHQNEGDEQGEH